MRELNIRGLYYITHIDNIPAILTTGILSHERIETEQVEHTPIFDNRIVINRRNKITPEGKSLWHYANLFFQPRNPMLYRVINQRGKQNLAVLRVAKTVLQKQGIFITDGVASNRQTRFYSLPAGLEMLNAKQKIIQSSVPSSFKLGVIRICLKRCPCVRICDIPQGGQTWKRNMSWN